MDFKYLLDTEEYDFIRNNKRLGRHVILLAMGGSYSYGTNNAAGFSLILNIGESLWLAMI